MTKDEALKLALEALEILYNDSELMVTHRQHKGMKNAITAIKEALAQPKQEPVAWPVGWVDDGGTVFWVDKPPADGADLYTTTPQRTWVGLTDEEIALEFYKFEAASAWYQFAHALDAKLKEKNSR